MNNKIIKGFTLAEVLITLSILGVVAAITIPNIIQNYKEKATVVKLKRTYSILQQAFDLAYAHYGSPQNWYNYKCDNDIPLNITSEQCKSVHYGYISIPYGKFLPLGNKKCSLGDINDNCYLNESDEGTKTLDGRNNTNTYNLRFSLINRYSRYLLKDGTFVVVDTSNSRDCAQLDSADETVTMGKEPKNICGYIYADINGKKKPNQWGKDIFLFYLTDKGIVPLGGDTWYSAYSHNNSCSDTTKNGNGCAAWILFKGNMDYLRKTTTWY